MTTSARERAVLPPTAPPVQTKLRIGAASDPLEREADEIADRVMRLPEPGLSVRQRCPSGCREDAETQSHLPAVAASPWGGATREAEVHGPVRPGFATAVPEQTRLSAIPRVHAKLEVSRADDPEEQEAERLAAAVMRMAAPDGGEEDGQSDSGAPAVHRACITCGDELRRQPVEEEDEEIVRAAPQARGAAPEVTPAIASSIHTLQGSGDPLSSQALAFFQPRFGVDLSDVRVHTNVGAAEAARALNARAFTVGNDVVFGPGQHTFGTTSGRRLLAHELAHVMQNRSSAAPPHVALAALDPRPAIELIDSWRSRASKALNSIHYWHVHNWVDFLGRTASNPSLSIADHRLASLAATLLGNMLTTIGGGVIESAATSATKGSAKAIGATIGTKAKPGGALIGFLIGALVEWAAAWAFENITGKTDVDIAAADAAERYRKLLTNQYSVLVNEHARAMNDLEVLVNSAKQRAWEARNQQELDDIASAALEERQKTEPLKDPEDLSLSNELLKIWVLEHAGSVGKAHGSTSPTEWSRAVEHVFKGGAGLQDQPALLVYQTRAEWARAGLDADRASNEMLSEVNELLATSEPGKDAAERVRARFDNREYTFQGAGRRDAFKRYVDDHFAFMKPRHTELPAEFEVRCTLDVSSDRDSVYISEWKWVVKFAQAVTSSEGGDVEWEFDREIAFDVWPTWG